MFLLSIIELKDVGLRLIPFMLHTYIRVGGRVRLETGEEERESRKRKARDERK
jgi:hypothetical protein